MGAETEKRVIVVNLAVIGVTYLITLLPVNSLGTYFQIFAYELGASPEVIGILLAIPYVISMLSRFFGGFLADALGRKPLVAYVHLLGVAAYAVLFIAPSWEWLILVQILAGLIYLCQAAETALLAESLPPERRSTGMTLVNAPSGVAIIVGPILASYVYATTGSVVATCRIFAEVLTISYLASFALRGAFVRETLSATGGKVSLGKFFSEYKAVFETVFSRLKAPAFLTFSIMAMFGLITFAQLYAIQYLGISPELWGRLLSLLAFFVILGAIPGMIIGDRVGRVPVARMSMLIASAGFIILSEAKVLAGKVPNLLSDVVSDVVFILLIGGVLVAIAYGMVYAVAGAYISELFPEEVRSKGITVLLFFGDIGLASGLGLAGFLYKYNPPSVYYFATAIVFVAFAVSFFLPETLKKGNEIGG